MNRETRYWLRRAITTNALYDGFASSSSLAVQQSCPKGFFAWRASSNSAYLAVVALATTTAAAAYFAWIKQHTEEEDEPSSLLLKATYSSSPVNKNNSNGTMFLPIMTRHCNRALCEMATTTSQRSNTRIPMCGEWCASAAYDTPCRMDTSLIPCKGEFCETIAGRWKLWVLGVTSSSDGDGDNIPRRVSCDQYKAGTAFPVAARPCDPKCLGPETDPSRYPAPTGLGVFCTPGTCIPPARANPKYAHDQKLGYLECPCNWFGSECENDWMVIERISKQKRLGGLDQITLNLSRHNWERLIQEARPGCVVRINVKQQKVKRQEKKSRGYNRRAKNKGGGGGDDNGDKDSVVYEFVGAVADWRTPGEIELLISPPNLALRREVRYVAELLRALPEEKSSDLSNPIISIDRHDKKQQQQQQFAINPVISGFYNKSYEFLMEYLAKEKQSVKQVIIVSTGAGLSGALAAVLSIQEQNQTLDRDDKKIKVHLLHGIRDGELLPFSDRLNQLVEQGALKFTLMESGDSSRTGNLKNQDRKVLTSKHLSQALANGETLKSRSRRDSPQNNNKVYVQDALKCLDLLQDRSQIEETAFVVCGRIDMMDSVQAVLKQVCRQTNCPESLIVEKRLFVNV